MGFGAAPDAGVGPQAPSKNGVIPKLPASLVLLRLSSSLELEGLQEYQCQEREDEEGNEPLANQRQPSVGSKARATSVRRDAEVIAGVHDAS